MMCLCVIRVDTFFKAQCLFHFSVLQFPLIIISAFFSLKYLFSYNRHLEENAQEPRIFNSL